MRHSGEPVRYLRRAGLKGYEVLPEDPPPRFARVIVAGRIYVR
jgi:hypothetical protein